MTIASAARACERARAPLPRASTPAIGLFSYLHGNVSFRNSRVVSAPWAGSAIAISTAADQSCPHGVHFISVTIEIA
jgi:hypothetical protein